MPRDYTTESLSHDPIHGYIPFISRTGLPEGEVSEQEIIDHPWVQRMRQIHQLQTAWFVFPSAEHMRFQHVMGAMHLASRAINLWYDSLVESCPDSNVPSKAYVESLVRLAALLHDIGHGPFGHFFDDHYLAQYNITHENIGAHIIEHELGDLIQGVRRNPGGCLPPLEVLDPKQVGWLICRPKEKDDTEGHPDWLTKLRALFSGIYTVDNMDFVLRDAYMSGYNTKAFDLSRLLHYSFFTKNGLTIHARGLSSLVNFVETRANLFRIIYFHRTVRAIDISLEDLFPETMALLFQGNPLDDLEAYQGLTESSFLVDVRRWARSDNPEKNALGQKWKKLLGHDVTWKMACERTFNFHTASAERQTIFSEPDLVIRRIREKLPKEIADIPLKADVARHYHRPSGRRPAQGQNFYLENAQSEPAPLNDDELFKQLPISFLILRIYTTNHQHDGDVNEALNSMLGDANDAKTNM